MNRRDIHGVDRYGRHVERRHDFAATTRRVCGRAGRRRVGAGVGAAGVVVAVTAALAGFVSTAVFVTLVGAVAASAIVRYVPDVVFDPDVAPKSVVTETHEDGLTSEEYARRLAIHHERNELKDERIEKRRREQERKTKANARSSGHTF